MSWPLIEQRRPDDEDVDPEPADELGRLAVDPAVDVDLAAERPCGEQVSRAARSFPGATSLHERLAAEAGLDGHDQDDVEELAVRLAAPRSGVAGLTARPGRPSRRPDPAQGRLDRLVDLDVERDRVAAGVEELVDVAAGLADHQVGVERAARSAAGGALIVFGPKVRFGTKWPSMTSRWIRSAPAVLDAPDGVGQVRRGRRRGCSRRPAPDPCPRLLHRPRRGDSAVNAAGRLVAALAAQRGCALARRVSSRRRATAGAGGSPARSAASWPQAAPISWPRLRRIVVAIPAVAEASPRTAR